MTIQEDGAEETNLLHRVTVFAKIDPIANIEGVQHK